MSQEEDEVDWFDKDEDDIVSNLKTKSAANVVDNTEYISFSALESFEDTMVLEPATSTKKIVQTSKLREMSKMEPVDTFLFAATVENDFFKDQIVVNDSSERVLLYVRVLVQICDLELPGFLLPILCNFVEDEKLLVNLRNLCAKLFCKKYKSVWGDEERVDQIIGDMRSLFLHTLQENVVSDKCHDIVQQIVKIIERSDFPANANRNSCRELLEVLRRILSTEEKHHSKEEMYPTLEDLFNGQSREVNKLSLLNENYQNTDEYIETQKYLLREDFMISLRECVLSLKSSQSPSSTTSNVFEDVQIVLNEDFLEADRSQMLFVDILGSRRRKESELDQSLKNILRNIKTRALLCFTTSYDFSDLIIATVAHVRNEKLMTGYISIEIIQQYNIGSIYNQKFIMIESPAFFEPYHNVFEVIKSYGVNDIPMKKYIVSGEVDVSAPSYLNKNATYKFNNLNFNPTSEVPKNIQLNESQRVAYKDSLNKEFCLIHGPPGTGKTYLSVEIVKTLAQNVKTPVVLITYTNESLDKFLLKLSTSTENIVRFGSQSKNLNLDKFKIDNKVDTQVINPLLKRLYYVTNLQYKGTFAALQKLYQEFDGTEESFQQIVGAQKELRGIQSKLRTIQILFQYYIVKDKQIIAMTTTCAAKTNFLFRLLQSAVVVFEEAAEILESHVVACLTQYTQHVIMIGDHLQLQPYTSSFQHSRSYDMNISLFERLINRKLSSAVLNTQYRMRPEIVDLICPTIYTTLSNAAEVGCYPHVREMQKDIFFLTHENPESNNELQISKYNMYECEQIVELAQHLISRGNYSPQQIVILSPYAKQIEHLSRMLQTKSNLQLVKTATVDSFQGLESDIVLLSLVRSNKNKQIGFLSEKNRICVALSRAKQGLYVTGNMRLLSECSPIWRTIEEKLIAQEAIGTAFPYA